MWGERGSSQRKGTLKLPSVPARMNPESRETQHSHTGLGEA